ncbi:hypothetical protein HU675_0038505 [Bradyrhizobium septentrionale]|uniref:hypothetical protein n=1 Tax=Bradyrhizobium septentrionale TaxID=1404411 RepID=UPI001596B123|nr:hypothetical protein [Bradyrhizobium septentrionale]UGY23779.1 hypothetical protein HU675_0038505 [Bradyrhizobium septentrionale]
MSTTHLIAINGDLLSRINDDPAAFADAVVAICSRSGGSPADREHLQQFGAKYLNASMNGADAALRAFLAADWELFTGHPPCQYVAPRDK